MDLKRGPKWHPKSLKHLPRFDAAQTFLIQPQNGPFWSPFWHHFGALFCTILAAILDPRARHLGTSVVMVFRPVGSSCASSFYSSPTQALHCWSHFLNDLGFHFSSPGDSFWNVCSDGCSTFLLPLFLFFLQRATQQPGSRQLVSEVTAGQHYI